MRGKKCTKEDFWSNVSIKKPDECWEWRGGKNSEGYGYYSGERAHRRAYKESNKCLIPFGKQILHKCDNPICCNPKHLYIGTPQDNATDRSNRNRGNIEKIAFSLTTLYADKILVIRRAKSKYTIRKAASLFNVSYSTIQRIWKADKWPCKEGYYINFK